MASIEITKAPSQNASPDKNGHKSPIIDLRNGKVICKQKIVSFEKQSETLQEIVKFREMLEEHLENGGPALSEIPLEHQPVIAKLAHESDKGLGPLAKHIRQELLPVQDEEDAEKTAKANSILAQSVVEAAINSILDRHNYGLEAPLGVKVPATVSVWRWEVKNPFKDWLPKSGREKAEARLEERKSAKKALNILFESLPQSERDTILRIKGPKPPATEGNHVDASTPEPSVRAESVTAGSATKQGKKRADDADVDEANSTPKAVKQPKPVDHEKAAKEKERLEKKAAKAERERKVKDAQNKSRSIMANFFSKPKVIIGSSRPTEAATAAAGPSKVRSDFEKTFKPFVRKKDSVLAPVNWFKESRKRKPSLSAAVIDLDEGESAVNDVQMSEVQPSENEFAIMTGRERLQSIVSSLPPSADPSRLPRRRKLPFGYRTYCPTSVRDVVNQLSEAEVAGDDGIVRSLLAKLQDRSIFPPKVFIFSDDARPGYYGTWTRNSRMIGPRRPLAKDLLVFDYGYDSGEEWEEEPAGEDVAEDNEDEEETEADADSDADSWLVDDDDEPEPVNLSDIHSLTPPEIWDLPPLPPHPSKRKANDSDNNASKKRRVVVPLVPFAKGPCWEETIGECSYDPFKPYQIRLFNDTPYPIDPFTYVSTCIEDQRASVKALAAASTTNTTSATHDGFAIPPVPIRLSGSSSVATTPSALQPPASSVASTSPIPNGQTPPAPPTKRGTTLKTPFPDAHLPYLVGKIAELETSSFVLLVETVYEALKPNKVTKAAVEAKIREVGEKDKVKKKWTVKPAFQPVVR